ncbi:polyketide cyclase [Aeromicrobium sp. Root495]|uniref:hypothetical protein n=1 Tax=Aeromicrobium sp. Root495 TaxID=1736550 RepID=UPI000700BC8C|nr:hypothetical protein [Aeromicrobium sp. Root495]KQY60037.1 polyketide cyclase [Aeromicrobium sp. Root495]
MLGDRWGVSPAETRLVYGCDALVHQPTLEAWRGVTVEAPSDVVWRWVRQIRLAPYSYDWVDNLGRRSPDRLHDLPDPVVGDPFTATAGRPVGRVLAVDPGRELTGSIMGAVMSYLVVPQGPTSSRLLLKIAARSRRPVAALLCLGDLPMARKQLLTLKSRAEAGADH